jgi:hypothetical protein
VWPGHRRPGSTATQKDHDGRSRTSVRIPSPRRNPASEPRWTNAGLRSPLSDH